MYALFGHVTCLPKCFPRQYVLPLSNAHSAPSTECAFCSSQVILCIGFSLACIYHVCHMAPEGLVASKVLGVSGPVWRSLDVLFAQWLLGRTFGHAVAATHSVSVGQPSKAINSHRPVTCTQQTSPLRQVQTCCLSQLKPKYHYQRGATRLFDILSCDALC